jgi:hypothetical protein
MDSSVGTEQAKVTFGDDFFSIELDTICDEYDGAGFSLPRLGNCGFH